MNIRFEFDKWWEHESTEIVDSRATDGKNGTGGGNGKNIKNPNAVNGIRLPYILNEYKSFLRENINNRFNKFSILTFLNLLERKIDVRKLYDVHALINDFQGLEEQFSKLGDKIDFSPFYSLFLESINAYASRQKVIQNEDKKVLSYIYTAALGRISNLRENSEKILIIDMRAYLNIVEDNIKTLKDLQVTSNKVDVINKYKENYRSGIDKKIEEAESLIEKQINPEIKKINTEIDDHINSLIKETIELQRESEGKLEKLNKQKKALQNTMKIKGIFNCLKIFGEVASLMGPYGKIAGTVINGVSTIAEPLVLDKEKESLKIPSGIESSLETLKKNIESLRGKKVDHLEKILENVEEEIKKNPETLSDLTSKIKDTKDKLKQVKDKEREFSHVRHLEKELKENIKKKGVDLKAIKPDEKIIDASKAIEKIEKIFKFGSLFAEMYEKYKEDKTEIDTVTESMEKMTDTITTLKNYELNIYETIAPMLQNMEDELKDISSKLKTKSHVALDVTKWQVQSSLKEMKLQMKKFTEGREVKDNLGHSIEKLDGAMTTLINVYDRMQSYQDQQNLANYIADISSVAANNINIQDQDLANAVNRLEFVIRANLVMEQYKSALNGLKQWVFPFADYYIEKPMLPSQLQLNPNIENLLHTVTTQIEAIRRKLDQYDTSIMKSDQNLRCEEFTSRFSSSKPFYVWKNEENRRSISSLLSGKEVVLKADITASAPHKEAIKFNEIEFDFKIKNETAQPQLTEILKGFDIYATHLGNSYYRYEDQISLMNSDSLELWYSYEKNDDRMPIRSNEAYNKLKNGDILLSPYALWEVRLSNQESETPFDALDKYRNEVNVELSGLGSYVVARREMEIAEINTFFIENITFENDTIQNNTMASPMGAGLRGCKRSKYRSARSVNGIAVDVDFMTNDATKGISSPITLVCNFLRTYFVSNLLISFNQALFGKQKSVRNDGSELPYKCTETRNICPTVLSNPRVRDTDATSEENESIKGKIGQQSDTIFDVNFHDNNSCLKSYFLIDQKYGSNHLSPQFPDLSCSLLLADLVTRTITRNKYKSPIHECLQSPRDVMLERISDGAVRNESDIKIMLQRHLSEKEVKIPSSWFSKLNGYAKSLFQVLGLVGNSDNEEYVQDLRHLFA